MAWGANGQWVRSRNPEAVRIFLAEQALDEAHRRRTDEFLRRVAGWVWRKVTGLFRRGR